MSGLSNAAGGQSYKTNIRLVITLPPRITKLLDLSRDQHAQLQATSGKYGGTLLNAEQQKQRAFTALQKAIMNPAFDEGAVKQRQSQLVAASDKRVQVIAQMLTEMRKVLTSKQVIRIRPELPLERTDYQLIVQLPEGFSAIGLSRDQNARLGTVVRSSEPKMIALSRKEKAAREAFEQAIFSDQFDEATVNQRREELVAVLAEQIQVNTGILLEARKILTPAQTKHLNEITPDY
jgi:Spy/CpxP family protein refolding chaperone